MEIVSADSMLVYRGLDIGTAKPTVRQRREVVYHGLDLAEPGESFSAGKYLSHARKVLRLAGQAGRIQIVAGGTGLYLKGLLMGMGGSAAPRADVRAQVQAWFRAEGLDGLANRLRALSPEQFRQVEDPRNPRRVQRALEYALEGTPPPGGWQRQDRPATPAVLGLTMDRDALRRRIARRVDVMYENGLVEEAAALRTRVGGLSPTAAGAIGYAEALAALDGRCSIAEAKSRTVIRTRQLAKRQLTWFRRQLSVHWIEVAPDWETEEIADRVRAGWRELGPATLFSGESRHDGV